MTDDFYKEAIRAATEELNEVLERHRKDKERIAQLRASILSLSRLCGDIPYDDLTEMLQEPGLTDAIRGVFQESGKELTPVEVRQELLLSGYNLSEYNNVLASIHTTLKRLVSSGEIEPVRGLNKTAYKSTGSFEIGPVINPFAGQGSTPKRLVLKRKPQLKKKKE